MTPHRWFGWPGAWCLDCGLEDPLEAALAHPETVFDDDMNIKFTPVQLAVPCPCPGSKRHDPYAARMVEKIEAEIRDAWAEYAIQAPAVLFPEGKPRTSESYAAYIAFNRTFFSKMAVLHRKLALEKPR